MSEPYQTSYEEKIMLLALRSKSLALEFEKSDVHRDEGVIVTSPEFFEVYDEFIDIVYTLELAMEPRR